MRNCARREQRYTTDRYTLLYLAKHARISYCLIKQRQDMTTMTTADQRLTNGRRAIDRAGGVGKVSKLLGYANPSFLSQIFGPNPTRLPTDKMMRKLERSLGLPDMSLDKPAESMLPEQNAAALNTAQLAHIIQLVSKIADEESVSLNSDRLASIIAMGYEDAAENDGQPRESKLRQVVQLLR